MTKHARYSRLLAMLYPWAQISALPHNNVAGILQVDQAALTGESLPAKKLTGDVCFSGSAIKQGERHAIVYATGINTFFGRAAALINSTNNVANLQIVMTKIGGVCLVTIGIWLVIELAVQFGHYKHECEMGEGKPGVLCIWTSCCVCPPCSDQQNMWAEFSA